MSSYLSDPRSLIHTFTDSLLFRFFICQLSPTIFALPLLKPFILLLHIFQQNTLFEQFLSNINVDKMTADPKTAESIYAFSAKDIDGKEVSFEKYRGKVLLVVNVASQCGFTDSNYKQLKETLDKYKAKGLEIAAFPCNQFGHQEPGCEIDIKEFVNKKYQFEPDLYAKIDVNGSGAHPIYQYLKKEQGGTLIDAIKWNFTKFLVNRKGKPVARFAPTTEPNKLHADIEKLLEKQA